MNEVKSLDPLTRPHMCRVTGVGHGRKHVHHGLAVPSTKESRYEARHEKRRREMEQSAETERLRADWRLIKQACRIRWMSILR